jgi:pimeloyl-ACP methyl ester carboxylesterase
VLLIGLLATSMLAVTPTVSAWTPADASASLRQPAATGYSLTPLLTGGILTTERDISLTQTVSVRQADPDPDGCNPYADGRLDVVEKSTVTGLVDLGYADVPDASPQPPTTILPAYTKIAGYMDMNAKNWGCNEQGLFLATGGTCRHTFVPGLPATIVEPQDFTLEGQEYVSGESTRVTGWPNYEPGLACLMRDGEVPFAPGGYMLDYWGDAMYHGAYVRPDVAEQKDEAKVRFDMAKTDSSCVSGNRWWDNQHSTGFYIWTGVYEDYVSDHLTPTCSSQRSGFAQTKLERALVVNEIKILQMTPTGGYVEVPASEPVIDGNTVKIEMLIENQWREDITADVKLWDAEFERMLETEKGQVNPVRETFVAGAQKKVTFLWRTDGVAWETPGKPITSRTIDILTPFGGARATVKVEPRPALLLHGWRADPSTWSAWPGFVSSVRGDWTVRAVEGMNTDPRDGVSIQGNARRAQATIEQVRRDTGAVHVDLIGHSMGGLISRWYLSTIMPAKTEDGRPLVRSLTMMGTPNLGSDCANDVLNGAYAARATAALAGQTLEVATGKWIPTIQLTPAYLTGSFRAQTPPRGGVAYGYMGGDGVPIFACGVSDGSYGQGGDNDLVVVVPSLIGAGLGGRQLQPLDWTTHIQMGGSRKYFDTTLAKVVGLGPPDAVTLSAARGRVRDSARASVRPTPVLGVTAAGTSAVLPTTRPLTLSSPGGSAVIHVTAPAGMAMEVIGPDGTSLGTGVSTGWPQRFTGTTRSGDITVKVAGKATEGDTVTAALSLPDDPRRVMASVSRQGSKITLTAQVQGPQASRAAVRAVVNIGTPEEKVVTLRKKGRNYTAVVTVTPSDAIPIAVVASIGGQSRMAVLGA